MGLGSLGAGTRAQGSPLTLPRAVGYGSEPPHHHGGIGLRLSSWMSAPAGTTLSFTPADRPMVTFNPAMPHSISGLDLNLRSQLENRGKSVSLLHRNAARAEKSLTDRLQRAQITTVK